MPSKAVVPAGDWPLPGPSPSPHPTPIPALERREHRRGGPTLRERVLEGWHRGQCSGEGQLSAVSGQHHCGWERTGASSCNRAQTAAPRARCTSSQPWREAKDGNIPDNAFSPKPLCAMPSAVPQRLRARLSPPSSQGTPRPPPRLPSPRSAACPPGLLPLPGLPLAELSPRLPPARHSGLSSSATSLVSPRRR